MLCLEFITNIYNKLFKFNKCNKLKNNNTCINSPINNTYINSPINNTCINSSTDLINKKLIKYKNLILLKSKDKNIEYRYYIIKGNTKYINNKAKELILNNYKEIIRINNIHNNNNNNLLIELKNKTKDKVIFNNNKCKLLCINQEEFINIIKSIYL